MLSIVSTTETLLSTEKFLIKIRRRSLGDSCSDGTIILGVNFREELSEPDKLESGLFSLTFDLIYGIAIKIMSLISFHLEIASK